MAPPHRSLNNSFSFSSMLLFLLLVLFHLHSATAAGGLKPKLLGDYRPIKNLRDPHVIEIAKFAVSEHNKQAHSNLQFIEVVKGEAQIVKGKNFRLVIEANDGAVSGDYQAVVHEHVSGNHKSLTSFTKL
ncbi:hypothetical protein Dimus_035070 [Dionaea muscipula]